LAEEIIDEYGHELESITLVKGDGGRFEVDVDGQNVFSKAALHRHASPGEIVEKMRSVVRGA
jgi:predicted Rdx family selenoprotein